MVIADPLTSQQELEITTQDLLQPDIHPGFWKETGAWDKQLYVPKPSIDTTQLDHWEQQIYEICKKYYYGFIVVDGPRGAGKTGFAWWLMFWWKVLFDRKVGADRRPRPAFGDCMWVDINALAEELDKLDAAQTETGDFHNADSWLPGMAIFSDEIHRLLDKRRTQTKENQVVTDVLAQIRHYGIALIGCSPDANRLDAQRGQTAANAYVACNYMSNGLWTHAKIRPIETMGANGVQRVSGRIDDVYIYMPKWCNLYYTKNPYGARPKLGGSHKLSSST
jgi:hypothetical protein